ncbi:unnamed protein product [Diabrotica balteata]|uniref:Uncharacterized protein n=1 Tax=Diabrotica balteata TaxID=107213 RepID=A0A9N9TA11_DIABA|nr:unnamed protein product [Diabrotica balteata]
MNKSKKTFDEHERSNDHDNLKIYTTCLLKQGRIDVELEKEISTAKEYRVKVLERIITLFVPCAAHSLNLVVQNAAEKDSPESEQKLSPKRVKATRWSSRFDAVKALKINYGSIKISMNINEKNVVRVKAAFLSEKLDLLKDGTTLLFWLDILQRVNEGIFRLACENVLKVMRKGRETLLTLLEAFVYDPLIDWTVGGEVLAGTTFGALNTDMTSKQSKKELEREVTLAMFNVRCTEMRAEWNENKEEVLNEIPNIIKNLNEYLELNGKVAEIEDKLQDLHQQLALIKEAEAQGAHNHSLYSLPSHYDAYHKSQISVNNAKTELRNIIKDSEEHVNVYSKLFILYDTQQFSQWLMDVKINITEDSMRIFDLVKEFLHNAGKNDVITQCERSEQEVFQLLQLLNISVRKCLQIYQDYFLILTQCPKSYLDSHRIYMYIKWSKFLLETHDYASCDVIYEQIREFLVTSALMHPQIVTVAYSLETFYKDNLMNVNKLFGDLETIRSKDSNETLEKVYNNAKTGINTFINMEKGAVSALEFVIASELVLLNRNLLTLEIAAQRSGDWLIKLTSRDGDWFLDDLLLHSTKAVEMISNLPTLKQTYNESFYKVLSGIKIASNIYKGLYDLNFNFHTIILLETMKKMQAEEPSVIELVNDLNKVVADIGVSIPDMISQLEKLLTCVLMQMDYNVSSF